MISANTTVAMVQPKGKRDCDADDVETGDYVYCWRDGKPFVGRVTSVGIAKSANVYELDLGKTKLQADGTILVLAHDGTWSLVKNVRPGDHLMGVDVHSVPQIRMFGRQKPRTTAPMAMTVKHVKKLRGEHKLYDIILPPSVSGFVAAGVVVEAGPGMTPFREMA